jgi:serine/threonine protein kinase
MAEMNSTSTVSPGRPAARDEGKLPARIGHFEIRQQLGEGMFGVVYRAYDPRVRREVALKVAKPAALATPLRRERFLREPCHAGNLRHPNIVQVFEAGQDGDHYFIASAFMPGGTLEAEIANRPEGQAPDLRRAVEVVRKLAEALAYSHKHGVTHRDVKPGNVLLDEQGEPILVDFGLAAREAGEERLTQDGRGMGTPAASSWSARVSSLIAGLTKATSQG